MKKLNLIIRGFLYLENWTPNSSQKEIYKPYVQDFRIVEDKYKKLFNLLKTKYDLKITFCSYTSTPEFIINYMKNKEYNLHLIPLEKKYQFNHTCDFLKSNSINSPTIILRSDLILSDLFIKKLFLIDYYQINKIVIIGREPKNKLIDILFIVPNKFINDIEKTLFNKENGHFIEENKNIKNNILFMEYQRFNTCDKNKYYQILRGDKKENNEKKFKILIFNRKIYYKPI